jgi:hypothetical protein
MLGAFATASPERAARIWGWKRIAQLGPRTKTLYLRCYRALGILLCLAGALTAIESVWFPS